MDITFILSILGSITGTSGLLIQLFNYLRAKPKLKISTPRYHENWSFKSGYNDEWGYIVSKDKSNGSYSKINFAEKEEFYVFAIQLLISNKSSSPITIHEIKSPNPEIYSMNKYHFHLNERLSENDVFIVNELKKLDFPIRIQPFDSVQTSVALYSKNTNIRTDKLKIILNSAAGKKRYTVTNLERYDEMMSHRQSEL